MKKMIFAMTIAAGVMATSFANAQTVEKKIVKKQKTTQATSGEKVVKEKSAKVEETGKVKTKGTARKMTANKAAMPAAKKEAKTNAAIAK